MLQKKRTVANRGYKKGISVFCRSGTGSVRRHQLELSLLLAAQDDHRQRFANSPLSQEMVDIVDAGNGLARESDDQIPLVKTSPGCRAVGIKRRHLNGGLFFQVQPARQRTGAEGAC